MRNGLLAVSLLAIGILLTALGLGVGEPSVPRPQPLPPEPGVPSLVLAGNVVADQGGAVPHAVVDLVQVVRAGGREERRFFADLRTDDSGAFRFVGLPVGEYWLHATAPGHLAGGRAIELREEHGGGLGRVEVVLPRGAMVTGRVVDDDGAPVPGATLVARQEGDTPLEVEAVADETGHFELGPVRKDVPVAVTADHAAYQSASLEPAPPGGEPLTVVLRRTGVITGRVVDDAGEAVGGTRVAALPETPRPDSQVVTATTAADGSFQLDAVDPGATRLVVDGETHLPAESSPLDVRAGKRVEGVVVVVRRGARLVVHTVDDSGAPISDAVVELGAREDTGRGGAADRVRHWPEHVDPVATVRSDDSGTARLPAIAPGHVMVRARAGGRRSGRKEVAVPAHGEVAVELVLHAPGAVAIEGADGAFVLRGPDSEGPWAPVLLRASDAPPEFDGLLPGSYALARAGAGAGLWATADGWQLAGGTWFPVEVTAGRITRVSTVAPLSALSGSIERDGAPLVGAEVRIAALPPRTLTPLFAARPAGGVRRTTTDAQGRFVFPAVAPGVCVLAVLAADARLPALASAEVAATPSTTVLHTTAHRLVVVVQAADAGAPLADAAVHVQALAQPVLESVGRGSAAAGVGVLLELGPAATSTGAGGEAVFEAVPAGVYEIEAEHPGHVPERARVTVGTDREQRAIVLLQPAGAVAVRVVDVRGRPRRDARVWAIGPTGERHTATAAGDAFVVDGLRPGGYRIEAEADGDEIRRATTNADVTARKTTDVALVL